MIDPDHCPICNQFACDHSDEQVEAHVHALAAGLDEPARTDDEQQAARLARGVKAVAKQAEQDLKWIMADARGRRFMWNMLTRCGIYRSSYAAGQGKVEAIAFYEGERNIGLELLDRVLKQTPKAYATMTQENAPQ